MGSKMINAYSSTSNNTSTTSHVVLVHGASHGGWCWYKIRSLLECTGHKVTSPNLRGAGTDPTDPNDISSFEEYNRPLDDILAALPDGEKVILVGHSAGGLSVMEGIRKYPHKIHVGVFLAAVMFQHGFQNQQDISYVKIDQPDIFEYGYGEGHDHPPTSCFMKIKDQRKILYQKCPLEDCTLAAMMLRPFPTRALEDKKISEWKEAENKVPRVYIKAMDDNVYSKEQQEYLIKKWPPYEVYELDSDHTPMFSTPLELFGLLLKISAKFGFDNKYTTSMN